LAERRRPLDELEARLVRLHLSRPDPTAGPLIDRLRYVISLARVTTLTDAEGRTVDLDASLAPLARQVRLVLGERLRTAESVWSLAREVPDLVRRARELRAQVVGAQVDGPSLEAEVSTRLLAVASGGGGGAGYVYPGSYEVLERAGLVPDLMAGTSIGSLMSMFRCRLRRWDMAPLVAAARRLSWTGVFRMLQTESRYGLPATLRLHLRAALGELFQSPEGRPLRLSDLEIPLYIVATGITVDALKHDLNYYEHLLDSEVRGRLGGVRSIMKVLGILREFLSKRDALVEVVLGRDQGTEGFDVLDAAGFSAAIPGVIHYDVLRDDPRMKAILDQLYGQWGITRLGEGGMVSNVPARILWETAAHGHLGRRNVFVLALDCFAPRASRLPWYPFQQAVRSANVEFDRNYADLYIDYARTLSPMNLVPEVRDALTAIRWGREALAPDLPFVTTMMRPLPRLPDEG
jgi:predicted acylesterase/phospholipase RssA